MSRGRLRVLAVAGGGILLLGSRIAPSLEPAVLLWLSPIWLALVLGLAALGWLVARTWFGRRGALVLSVAAAGLGLGLTGIDWSGQLGTYLPCRRNWGWLPSYLPRSSPTSTLSLDLSGTRIKVCYGSPRARGRRMIGGSNVPYGRIWRTGANEPTTLRTAGPITIAGLPIGPGKVALYTIPGPETWEVVVNRSTSQWGLESEYTPAVQAQEVGRAIVPAERAEHYAERLTIRAEATSADSVHLVIGWEWVEVRVSMGVPRPSPAS